MIECPQCHSILKKEFINNSDFLSCLQCHQLIQVVAFPVLFQKPKVSEAAQPLIIDDQSNCFYHPDKKAIILCSSCGRFLCSLCDIEFDKQHLCPACLQSGTRKKRIHNIDNDIVCYDKIAFAVAVYPIITFIFTLITAPIAVYLSIRYWNTKSLTGSKARFVFAILIGLAQIIGWYFLFTHGFRHPRHHHG
ncbi:MAG: B-box zinc finger protein [Candidatus Omnitrophica bacterium]|nr:B-box zinc finger protein [Candidatus Omnitrophota bacterium]